ncbi:hypothetical protein HYPSUDRAFT_376008 [Hypholoma sublateritium FD-334 SS-4]|uniref:Uncharacterized protein n=1 Tax=Hypholoma sublateritium (strain FD-334 SS-4) TaxID=945553 RepID=A0A0D2Q2F2_HYPSF|nr:hypothetical protein HYPSUDRAFT_376008 [Hypholoma sublateritium FD-334 SS-4]
MHRFASGDLQGMQIGCKWDLKGTLILRRGNSCLCKVLIAALRRRHGCLLVSLDVHAFHGLAVCAVETLLGVFYILCLPSFVSSFPASFTVPIIFEVCRIGSSHAGSPAPGNTHTNIRQGAVVLRESRKTRDRETGPGACLWRGRLGCTELMDHPCSM